MPPFAVAVEQLAVRVVACPLILPFGKRSLYLQSFPVFLSSFLVFVCHFSLVVSLCRQRTYHYVLLLCRPPPSLSHILAGIVPAASRSVCACAIALPIGRRGIHAAASLACASLRLARAGGPRPARCACRSCRRSVRASCPSSRHRATRRRFLCRGHPCPRFKFSFHPPSVFDSFSAAWRPSMAARPRRSGCACALMLRFAVAAAQPQFPRSSCPRFFASALPPLFAFAIAPAGLRPNFRRPRAGVGASAAPPLSASRYFVRSCARHPCLNVPRPSWPRFFGSPRYPLRRYLSIICFLTSFLDLL